ncbi:hypothetical protein FRC07_010059 [Ceratobasidium sp. 392]|nr:hypothetical protein FRC07_010059 [Ceratobasidium sp. 392]
MGVVLIPECRNKGYGRAAVHKLLTYAFDALKVHRVFAHIVCPTASARSVEERKTSLFDTKRICHTFQTYGLQFEGVSRGAIMMEVNGGQNVWEDMHRLSILDIDWFSMQMGSLSTGDSVTWFVGPSTPWDAMEQRHERERKAILEWCDNSGSSKPAADVDEADDDEAYCCSDGSYEGSDE